jgi:hypothetical protein
VISVLVDVVIPIATAVGGAALVPLREFLLSLRDRRRYRMRVAALEAAAAQAPQPPAAELTVTDEALAELGGRIGTRPYFYLSGLRVRDLRCFRDVSLRLRFPGEYAAGHGLRYPNVTLLLGDNGSGKSTILKAIAMAALGPVLNNSGFVPYQYVNRRALEAVVDSGFIFGADSPEPLGASVSLTRRGDFEEVTAHPPQGYWSEMFNESSPSFFIVGYGTGRHVPEDSQGDPSLERGRRRRRYQRVVSLFEDRVSLVPLSSWLRQASPARLREVRELFEGLLPQRVTFTGQFDGGEPVFLRGETLVPLRAMSDGFRSYISWLGDLLFQLDAVASDTERLTDIGGIALVDEVDLLLHPSWQRVVVPTISQMLPRIQFVFTTHSPIVAATLEAENIILAREEEDGSVLDRINAEIHGLSAEQVLLSSYFGLESTRAPDAVPGLEALAREAVIGDKEATLAYLRALTQPTPPTSRGSSA